MLGKLFRYEWKSTWKIPVILLACMGGMTLIGCFSLSTLPDLADRMDSTMSQAGVVMTSLTAFGSLMLYLASILAACIGVMLYMAIRFYKNLYTDEGYLMHTLPVTSRQLIWSKGLVFFLWTVIVLIAMYASVFILLLSVSILNGVLTWQQITQQLPDFWTSFTEMLQINPFVYAITSLAVFLLSILQSIFLIYTAISLGQAAKKFKVMASIGCYIGLHILISIFSNVLMALFGFYKPGSLTNLFIVAESNGPTTNLLLHSYLPIGLLSLFLCVAFYCITEFMMSRHLNLE